MALNEIKIEIDEELNLPHPVLEWIDASRECLENYWDQFPKMPLSQYVESDFEYVARALKVCQDSDWVDGRLFLEWGCGFAVIAGIAALGGFDAVGIEAEHFLCEQAKALLANQQVEAEVWHGNFLPHGAHRLAEADDPCVSLSHALPPAYDFHDLQVSDFAMIFVYPWPGEDHFLRAVFNKYARRDALLLMYRGPYEIELYRKTK